ncbi:MAG: hypothetical protein N2643_01480 [Endomicrobia bacterium]|nr:hypothetical protein [Endomicrobiia bacterium]
MRDFLILIKVNILQFLNSYKYTSKIEKLRTIFITIVGILFFVGSYIISYQVIIYISSLPLIGSLFTVRILALAFLTSFLMLIFSSLTVSFSTLYESEDINFLLSMPLKFNVIFLNKYILTIVRSSWMVLLLIIPFIIAFSSVKNFNTNEYIILIISMLLKVFISASVGIMISISLSYFFPSKKLKNIVLVVLVIIGSTIYSLLRVSQPEKLLTPDRFSDLLNYLDFVSKPVAKELPSWWLTEIFNGLTGNDTKKVFYNFINLLLVSLIILLLVYKVFINLFFNSFFLISEKISVKKLNAAKFLKIKNVFYSITLKEIKTFLREPIQWVQFVIIIALSMVYIFNISKLPLEIKYVKMTVAFLNLGGIMFILTAIVLRFIFVQPSLEYRTFWLIKSLPINFRKIFITKFLVYLPVIFVPGFFIVVVSNMVLGIDKVMLTISIVIVLISCIVLPSAGYSLGILFPKNDYKDIAQIETSFGGLMFIVLSMCYIVLSLSSIAEPLRKYILGIKITIIEILIYSFIYILINFIYCFTPAYYANKKFIEEI